MQYRDFYRNHTRDFCRNHTRDFCRHYSSQKQNLDSHTEISKNLVARSREKNIQNLIMIIGAVTS